MRLSLIFFQASSLIIYSVSGKALSEDSDENSQEPESINDPINQYALQNGHHGIFKAFDWTDEELSVISRLHSTAEYHKLMTIVKLKLINSDLSESQREKIEKFMVRNRPPAVLRNLLSQHDKSKIREFMNEQDIEGILTLVGKRLNELPEEEKAAAIRYLDIRARE